jgi:outer membrane protein assembly factor BamE
MLKLPSPPLRWLVIFMTALCLLTGCARLGTMFLNPYRFEIQQGNFVSKEMAGQLRAGMTREQTRFILGTPMHTSIFHASQWDYVFFLRDTEGKVQKRQFSVFFDKDVLSRWQGDELPSETEVDKRASDGKK